MTQGLSIKTTVVGGIAAVALVSQLVGGVWQYQLSIEAKRQEIRHINEAALLAVADLASRGVEGGNQMILADAAASSLYQASGVLHLQISGTSAGAPATAFTTAIPPQAMNHVFTTEKVDAAKLAKISGEVKETGFIDEQYLFVARMPLPKVKNGGELVAVFPADDLRDIHMATLREGFPLALSIMALSVLLAWFIGRRIASPIASLSRQIGEVAAHLNLGRRIDLPAHETALNQEAGEAARAFNALLDTLQETLGQVRRNIASVAGAVSSLSSASQQVAHHSDQQSSAAAAMASAMEEMTANLAEIAHNAGHVDEASRASGARSREGSAIIGRASVEMGEIANTVQSGSASITALGQQSQKISAIVQVIREIADQTNLLALNAAIEAARAGEAGRGFAVVADEVRKLAERTALSTQQIGDMIQAIQTSARQAVNVMDDTVQRVDTGKDLAGQAATSIVQISNSVDTLLQGVAEISHALRQQEQASQDMSHHVDRIAGMTEENSHAANQTAQAARDLEGLAADMHQAVERFRL